MVMWKEGGGGSKAPKPRPAPDRSQVYIFTTERELSWEEQNTTTRINKRGGGGESPAAKGCGPAAGTQQGNKSTESKKNPTWSEFFL